MMWLHDDDPEHQRDRREIEVQITVGCMSVSMIALATDFQNPGRFTGATSADGRETGKTAQGALWAARSRPLLEALGCNSAARSALSASSSRSAHPANGAG